MIVPKKIKKKVLIFAKQNGFFYICASKCEFLNSRRGGGTGRRTGLKILWELHSRAGSSPALGTS